MRLLTLISNYWPGRSVDLHEQRGEVLPSHEQTPFSPLILLIGDHSTKDGLVYSPDHGLGACVHLDVPRLQLIGTSLACNQFTFWLYQQGHAVGESLTMAQTFLNLFVKTKGNYPAKCWPKGPSL